MTIGLIMTIVAGAFEAMAVATILPKARDDLGGLEYYGWVFSAFTLANMVGIVISGGEVDHSGPRRPFAAGIVLFTGGLLIGGFAPSMAVLIGGRVVQGLGAGMLTSVAYSVVGAVYPEAFRPRMLALWSTAWVIPGLVGPSVAGFTADHIGWRWVFFGMIPFPLIAALLTATPLRRLPEQVGKAREFTHVRDALLLAIGVSGFLIGVGRDAFVVGALLVAGGLVMALPPLRRLTPEGTFRAAPGPGAGVVAILLLNIGFFGVEAFLPLALTDLRHRSSGFAAFPLTVAALTWTAGAWVIDRRASRMSRVRMVRFGVISVTIAIALFLTVLRSETPAAVSFLSWGFAGLGMGFAFSTLQLIVLDTAPKGQEGIATASMQLANSLGIALAAGLGGVVIAALSEGDDATTRGIGVQSGLMIGVLILTWLVAGRLPEKADAQASSG